MADCARRHIPAACFLFYIFRTETCGLNAACLDVQLLMGAALMCSAP